MENNNVNEEKYNYIIPSKIIVKKSQIHGRGVFAIQDIDIDEIVERCPLVPLSFRSRYHSDPQIYNYLYSQPPCPCNECKNHGFIFHMVLGYGMLYNHQDNSNGIWKFYWEYGYADIIANKAIKSGDEIFVDYGTKYFNNKEKIELNNETNPE